MNPFQRLGTAWADFLSEHKISGGPVEKGGYFIDSPDLWNIRLDGQSEFMEIRHGVLYYRYPLLGVQANPAYIAWYGLMSYNSWLRTGEKVYFERAILQGRWLLTNAVTRRNFLCWEYNFNFAEDILRLKAPWPSAMAQGLAISLLIRLFRTTGENPFKEKALAALGLYDVPIEDGGIAGRLNGGLYFEEYPAYPLTLVLDGTLFALLGLYDLAAEEEQARKLLDTAATTLDKNWRLWDWHGLWSRYGTTGFLSSMMYHSLNCRLIQVFQEMGYLKSFHLDGWNRGMRRRKLAAICQMKRLTMRHIARTLSRWTSSCVG